MNVLLSVSLWLALIMSFCCGNSEKDVSPDKRLFDFPENSTENDFAEYDELGLMNKASGIGQMKLLLLLGLAVLQIWN